MDKTKTKSEKFCAAAQGALKEAALRRAAQKTLAPHKSWESPAPEIPAPEINGRKGLEPTRYGDWENKGIVSDF